MYIINFSGDFLLYIPLPWSYKPQEEIPEVKTQEAGMLHITGLELNPKFEYNFFEPPNNLKLDYTFLLPKQRLVSSCP